MERPAITPSNQDTFAKRLLISSRADKPLVITTNGRGFNFELLPLMALLCKFAALSFDDDRLKQEISDEFIPAGHHQLQDFAHVDIHVVVNDPVAQSNH